MTLLNFPPTNGQPTDGSFTYTANGVVYTWDGEKWTANTAGSGGMGTVHFTGDSPPPAGEATETDQWFNTNDGRLYTYTKNVNGVLVWADASPDSQGDQLWDRNGTTLEPANAGDDVDLGTGDLSAAAGTFSGEVLLGGTTPNGYGTAIGYSASVIGNATQAYLSIATSADTPGTQGMVIGYDANNTYFNNRESRGWRFDAGGNFVTYISNTGSIQTGGSDPRNNPNILLNANGDIRTQTSLFIYSGSTPNGTFTYDSAVDGNAGAVVVRAYGNNGTGTGGVQLSRGGTSWGAYSQRSLKTELIPITSGLDKVSTLSAVTGRYKTDEEGTSRSFLIADEVQQVLPEAVSGTGSEEDPLSLRYTEVIPLLVSALHDAKARIEALEATNASLEARLTALEGGN